MFLRKGYIFSLLCLLGIAADLCAKPTAAFYKINNENALPTVIEYLKKELATKIEIVDSANDPVFLIALIGDSSPTRLFANPEEIEKLEKLAKKADNLILIGVNRNPFYEKPYITKLAGEGDLDTPALRKKTNSVIRITMSMRSAGPVPQNAKNKKAIEKLKSIIEENKPSLSKRKKRKPKKKRVMEEEEPPTAAVLLLDKEKTSIAAKDYVKDKISKEVTFVDIEDNPDFIITFLFDPGEGRVFVDEEEERTIENALTENTKGIIFIAPRRVRSYIKRLQTTNLENAGLETEDKKISKISNIISPIYLWPPYSESKEQKKHNEKTKKEIIEFITDNKI